MVSKSEIVKIAVGLSLVGASNFIVKEATPTVSQKPFIGASVDLLPGKPSTISADCTKQNPCMIYPSKALLEAIVTSDTLPSRK